jgi:hypothetical protein
MIPQVNREICGIEKSVHGMFDHESLVERLLERSGTVGVVE